MLFLALIMLILIDGKELLSGQPQRNNPSDDVYDADELSLANNDFALKLHKTFGSSGNIFMSPVSIFTVLGMLYIGARGETAKEIRRALSYDAAGLSDETINHYFHKLLLSFVDSSDKYELEMANAIILQDTYPVLKTYKNALKNYYEAAVKEVNFMEEREKAIREINDWVSEKTHGQITKLLESLNRDTVLLLLNAAYFKGKWKKSFIRSLTSKRDFFNNGVNVIGVNTMLLQGHFFCGAFPEYETIALKMPYLGDRMSMLILLPGRRNGVREVEEKLTSTSLKNIIDHLEDRFAIIYFPKFKFQDSRELKQNLSSLGIKSAFKDTADFGGINVQANLKVTEVMHKSMVEVNEIGTMATGSTIAVAEPKMDEETFHFVVDRPFLFFIVDDTNGMILFSGRINEL